MLSRGNAFTVACAWLFASSCVFGQAHVLPTIQKGDIAIGLEPVAGGLGGPTYLTTVPDDTLNRQFVVDQVGLLRVIQNGALLSTPALDIRTIVSRSGFDPGNVPQKLASNLLGKQESGFSAGILRPK